MTAAITVLHLEDSDLDADLVGDRLRKLPLAVTVHRVTDKAGFIARLQEQRYDLILSDYQVPTFDELAALDYAHEYQPETPFIFVSGAMGEELAVETLKRGAVDYVLKDRLGRLEPAVARALSESRERVDRKLAERTVRDALTLLEGLAEGTEELISAIDLNYRFTVVNRAYQRDFRRLFGTEAKVGVSVLDALAHLPADQAHAGQLWGRALAGESFVITADFGDPYLDRRTFNLRFYPILDDAGRVVGAGEIASDVTDLAWEERRQRFLADLAVETQPLADPDAITATTARLLAIHLNADRCAYAEVEEESVFVIVGDYTRDVPSIVGRWPVTAFGNGCVSRMLANEPFVVNDTHTDPNIHPKDLEAYRDTTIRAVICVPLFKDGTFHSAMAVHQKTPRQWTADEVDLVETVVARCWEALERARALRQLRASEERFRTLVTTTSSIIWTTDSIGGIVEENPSWQAFTGQTRAEYSGWGWLKAVHPDDRERISSVWSRSLQQRDGYETEYRLRRHDREYRRVIARGAPVFAADGTVREWIGNCSDITERMRAEEGLARVTIESEQRRRLFETILSNTLDFAYVFSLDYRIAYANEILLRMWGRSWEESIGKSLLEIGYEPWHAAMHEGEIDEVVASGQPVRGEIPFTGTFGRRIYEYIFVPVFGDDGEVEAVAGTTRDVTDRKQQEEELAERERRYRLVADAANDAIWEWELATDQVTWNEGLRTNFGYTNEQVGSDIDWWIERIHPDEAERVTSGIHKHIEQGPTTWQAEYRFRRADGSYAYVFDRGRVVRQADGQPTRMVGSILDLTERRQAEQDLARLLAEEKRYAALLERVAAASRSINAVLSAESIARIVTEEACSILAAQAGVTTFTSAEDCRQEVRAATPAFDSPSAPLHHQPELDAQVAARVCKENFPLRIPQGDGAGTEPGRLAVPLVGHGGKNLGVVQLIGKPGDFTPEDELVLVQLAAVASAGIENARLYEQVREQDRRKDEFLATLAHELRNPLAPIRTGLSVLSITPAGDQAANEVLEVMERQVGHMVRLIDDLLDVSRITRGKVELKRERIDVRTVFDAAIEVSRSAIETGRHRLSITSPGEPLPLDADPTRMAQVVSNLLNNAAKYTPEGGRIELTAERVESEVVIQVRDTGVGIASEMLPKVFEMFTQVGQTLERAQGGLGIGLALVARLVEMHGGSVTAESGGLGKGSTFTIRLPLALKEAPLENPEARADATAQAVTSRRILVVDDNTDGAQTLALLLKFAGHTTTTAYTGPRALEVAREFRPDVVFLDIGLPGLNGYEVARQLRADPTSDGVVLVALTGWGTDDDRRRAREAGFDHHLTKPVNAALVETLLAEINLRDEGLRT